MGTNRVDERATTNQGDARSTAVEAQVGPAQVEQLMARAGGDPQKFGRLLRGMPPARRDALMMAAHELWGNAFVTEVYQAAYSDARLENAATDFAPASTESNEAGFGGPAPLTADQQAYFQQMVTGDAYYHRANRSAGDNNRGPVPAEEARTLAEASRTLTDQDRRDVRKAQTQLAALKPKRIDDPNNPNLVQIEIAFDGTGNNQAADPWDTGPARLHQNFDGDAKIYARGVATRGDTPNYMAEGATGAGLQARVDETYEQLVRTINTIKGEKPNAEVVLVISGFSRGSATARIFANQLNARGIPVRDAQGKAVLGDDGKVRQHAAPRIGVMLLFDTVYSYIGDRNNSPVPANVENLLHLTAADEHRVMFPLRHAHDPTRPRANFHEIALPGAHSDVGGGYPNAYSDVAYNMAHQYMENAGVQMKPNQTPDVDLNDPSLRLNDSGGAVPFTNRHFARRHQY